MAPPWFFCWRNDASQAICASDHDFLDDAQLPSLILRHLLSFFLYSVKSPFRGFYFSSENVFCILPSLHFTGRQSLLNHSFRAVNVITAFTLLPSTLWLAIPAATDPVFLPVLLLQPALGTSLLYFFLGRSIPTFLVCTVLFPSFSKAFHGAPSAPRAVSTAKLSVVFLLLPSEKRCNISGTSWQC